MEVLSSEDINSLILAKVTTMLVLGLSSFIIGISPIKIAKLFKMKSEGSGNNLTVSLLLCFGGGVLLFTTFIHLQPEVREGFEALEKLKAIPIIAEGIPLSEIVFCIGFFFVYMIEELAHAFLDKKYDHEVLHRSLSIRSQKKENGLTIPRVSLNKDDTSISCISNSNKELFNSQNTLNFTQHSHDHNQINFDENNSFSGLMAVLALSFHAVFEGLAVGLENSVQKVWYLFAAIATHKLVIAFCVGLELVTSNTKTIKTILYIGTFAVVTPLGIGAGIVLKNSGTSDIDITSVILQGMAAGTLLYVVFFEVLARERNNNHNGIWQLTAIVFGFFIMFTLQFATSHGHGHEHVTETTTVTAATTSEFHEHSHYY
ncbi:zinc transporter ZIP1-like [Onthophagus taurus]|uniref:zinc transporter ZIP1-like n=1 Tax=Onthophagus taurus TaxID=166361 RepID=UPI0039BE182C